ncbi:MAG: L-histidine N(alpha)-methyltransferase, partial [Balneolaceae bacterium]
MEIQTSVKKQSMLNEIQEGLRQPGKSLPSKFFYDEHGSRLFEQITRLREYYLTRTEKKIMNDHINEIAGCIGSNSVFIELGSGSSRKTRLLLDHLPNLAAYVPVEISERYLTEVVQDLKGEYPDLLIKPVCADYTNPFQVPAIKTPHIYYTLFYPGSTIGNFRPEQAQHFLETVSRILNPGGGMLIGVDLKKDRSVLEAAYNDNKGVTAEFNKNILHRLNRELGADFNPDQFRHQAVYNEEEGRIEMHLISRKS